MQKRSLKSRGLISEIESMPGMVTAGQGLHIAASSIAGLADLLGLVTVSVCKDPELGQILQLPVHACNALQGQWP